MEMRHFQDIDWRITNYFQLTFTFSNSPIPFVISLTCSTRWTINFETFFAKERAGGVGSFVDRNTAAAIPML